MMQFMGKPIKEMDREELLEVVHQLALMIENERAIQKDILMAWSDAQKGREWQSNYHH